MKLPLLLLTAFALASTGTTCAVVLIDSSGITATSGAVTSAGGDFGPNNTLDGLTLEGWRNVGNASRPSGHQENHWITNNALSDTIIYDLGGTYNLSKISILNTSNTAWNDRETNNFTVAVSTDGGSTFGAPSASQSLQDYTLGFQDFTLEEAGVTHVQLNVTNDPAININEVGPAAANADVAVGLNEVQFFQIPEPSSAILLGLGSAFLLRRKRQA